VYISLPKKKIGVYFSLDFAPNYINFFYPFLLIFKIKLPLKTPIELKRVPKHESETVVHPPPLVFLLYALFVG
jgi:hypothetical protein